MSQLSKAQSSLNPEHLTTHNIKTNHHQPPLNTLPTKESIHTSEISTQVNMDQEFPEVDAQKQKKREKKKQYKKRKRERQKDQEKYATDQLAEIITRIYQGETTFNKCKATIQHNLQWLIPGEKFHSFLNQAIRIHVKDIQSEMWKFMQDTIHENPFQKSNQDQQFYLLMIDKMYSQFLKLQISSRQIQKIINLYMFLKENRQKQQLYDLDRSTFNYFIESDETIKNLIKICERRLSIQHETQVHKLKQICEMMNPDDDDDDYYDEDQEYTEISTSVDEEDEIQQKTHKKKKKKNKKGDFSSSFFDIVKRLSDTVIVKQKQIKCYATEEWATSLREQFETNI